MILTLCVRPVLPQFVTPGPINPPQKTNSNLPPPSMLVPGPGRRQFIADLGPIDPPRPIQPIDSPTEPSGSESASPVRRSPSPKVPCSFVLATDDNEFLSTSRRTVVKDSFEVLFLLLPLTLEDHGTPTARIYYLTSGPPSVSRWIISLGNGKSERSVAPLTLFPSPIHRTYPFPSLHSER